MNRSCPRPWVVWLLLLAQVIISPKAEAEAEATVDALPSHIRQAMQEEDSTHCPKDASECAKHETKITCVKKGQTSVPLNCPKVCPDQVYHVCLYISCEHSTFKRNEPPTCPNCNEEPKVVEDCGCPKWECKPRTCPVFMNCTDKCTEQKFTDDKCGCFKMDCVQKTPAHQCSSGDCGECETCEERDFKPKGCLKEGMGKEGFCRPKTCEAPPSCPDCQQIKIGPTDSCGCTKYQCEKKTLINMCLPNDTCLDPCASCILENEINCPEAGAKFCKRQECSSPSTPTCKKCQIVETKPDTCNCVKKQCTWMPEINTCGRDNCAGDQCKECKTTSSCTDEDGTERGLVSQCATKPQPPTPTCNDDCTELVGGQPKCGFPTYTCERKTCPLLSEVPTECEKECEEPYKMTDTCNCDKWACRKKVPPPKPSICLPPKGSCEPCHICKVLPSGACGAWESRCAPGCPEVPEMSPECYETAQRDKCGCRIPPAPKACPNYPEPDKCPEGAKLVETTDPCGCKRKMCQCVPEKTPVNCYEKCEELKTYTAIGGCEKKVCERKPPPTQVELNCKQCEYVDDKTKDGCANPQLSCTPVNPNKCRQRLASDPTNCPEGMVIQTAKDICGCDRNKCVTKPPPCQDGKKCNSQLKCVKWGDCPPSCLASVAASISSLNKLVSS